MVMTAAERKASRKATMAKYRLANKEKIKLYNDRYVVENKENRAAYMLKYCAENKEKRAEYYKENKESISNVKKVYMAKYRLANKEKIVFKSAKYAAENKERFANKSANRRAMKFGATIYMTKEDKAKVVELYTIARDATKLFGYDWEVDHIVPLTKGGLHKLSNLQVVPMSWNRSKNNRNCDTYWD